MPGHGRKCQQEYTCMTSKPSTLSALPSLGCLLDSSERSFGAFCTPLYHLVPVALEHVLKTWENYCHGQRFHSSLGTKCRAGPQSTALGICASRQYFRPGRTDWWDVEGSTNIIACFFQREKESPLNQKDSCLLLIWKIRPGREYPLWWNLTKSIHWLWHISGQVLSACLSVIFPYHLCYSILAATSWLDSFNRLVYP